MMSSLNLIFGAFCRGEFEKALFFKVGRNCYACSCCGGCIVCGICKCWTDEQRARVLKEIGR